MKRPTTIESVYWRVSKIFENFDHFALSFSGRHIIFAEDAPQPRFDNPCAKLFQVDGMLRV
jgi:hypothetical protein